MYRPVWAEINLKALADNVEGLAKLAAPAELMAIVKADAYGHGAVEVARVALASGATRLGVASPEEALALRRAGITAPILVLGPLLPGQTGVFREYDLTATLASPAPLPELERMNTASLPPLRVHIKVDTGMGRLGFLTEEVQPILTRLRAMRGVEVEGVYSHLARADEDDLSSTSLQLERFRRVLHACDEVGGRPPLAHIANTAGLLRSIGKDVCNVVRSGLGIYGVYPFVSNERPVELRPVMSLRSRVVAVKRVGPGVGVSYGHIYTTSQETTLCTVPVGYADGLRRGLSGRVRALIHGKPFPVVGRICMDQCVIEVGDERVSVGDEVVFLGSQDQESICVEEWAEHLGTIPYELLCGIAARVPRVYV